jgi:hypothetical protein
MIVDIDVVMKSTTPDDGKIDRVLKIKFPPHDRYVEMAAKHFKLLTDVMQVVDTDKLNERINRGRQRNASTLKEAGPLPRGGHRYFRGLCTRRPT